MKNAEVEAIENALDSDHVQMQKARVGVLKPCRDEQQQNIGCNDGVFYIQST